MPGVKTTQIATKASSNDRVLSPFTKRVPLRALQMLTQSVSPLTRDYVQPFPISVNINTNSTTFSCWAMLLSFSHRPFYRQTAPLFIWLVREITLRAVFFSPLSPSLPLVSGCVRALRWLSCSLSVVSHSCIPHTLNYPCFLPTNRKVANKRSLRWPFSQRRVAASARQRPRNKKHASPWQPDSRRSRLRARIRWPPPMAVELPSTRSARMRASRRSSRTNTTRRRNSTTATPPAAPRSRAFELRARTPSSIPLAIRTTPAKAPTFAPRRPLTWGASHRFSILI